MAVADKFKQFPYLAERDPLPKKKVVLSPMEVDFMALTILRVIDGLKATEKEVRTVELIRDPMVRQFKRKFSPVMDALFMPGQEVAIDYIDKVFSRLMETGGETATDAVAEAIYRRVGLTSVPMWADMVIHAYTGMSSESYYRAHEFDGCE